MTRPKSIGSIAQAAAKRAADAHRKRDVIDVRQPPADTTGGAMPTAEQMRHADYVEQDIVDRTGRESTKIGKAYRRLARFETIEGVTADQLRALRFYREAYDAAQISPTKSALDIRPRGGGGAEGTMSRMEAIVSAGGTLRRIENSMAGSLLPTLRAVAGEDRDFKAIAIERFGGRSVSRVDASKRKPKVTSTLEPKSNRHRQIVRDEFLTAADRLVGIVAPMIATTDRRPAVRDE